MSSLLIAGAIGLMNITTYGLTLAAARLLGPREFGQFSAVLGLLILVNVVSLGLQATAARRMATGEADPSGTAARVLRATRTSALGVTLFCVALTPVMVPVLRLESAWTGILTAVTAGFLCAMGGQAGLLQGSQRWVPLALVYSSMGLFRLVFGVGALLVSASTLSAMIGVAAAAVVPALVGHIALRQPSTGERSAPVGAERASSWVRYEKGGLPREVLHSSHALGIFFAMSNVDMILARALLDDQEAGLYAAGVVLTKAALFLPQFVVIILFPSMARATAGRRVEVLGLGFVALTGGTVAATVAALPSLALVFVGGAAYAEIAGFLWAFAWLGTVLALIQLLVYSAIARGHTRALWVLWLALPVTVAAAFLVGSARDLLTAKVGIDVAVLIAMGSLLLLSYRPDPSLPLTDVTPSLAEDTSSPEQPPVR